MDSRADRSLFIDLKSIESTDADFLLTHLQTKQTSGGVYIQVSKKKCDSNLLVSAECTIGMIWGVGIAKALWHYGAMELWH